jgi:hypothetical protein
VKDDEIRAVVSSVKEMGAALKEAQIELEGLRLVAQNLLAAFDAYGAAAQNEAIEALRGQLS